MDKYFNYFKVTYETHKGDMYIFTERIPVFDSKTLEAFTVNLTIVARGRLTTFKRDDYYTVKEIRKRFREVEVSITRDESYEEERVPLL